MHSSNPALRSDLYNTAVRTQETMSFAGVFNKGMILFVLLLMTFIYSWNQTIGALENGMMSQSNAFAMIGGIGGFIFALITIFKKDWAMFTAPVYALFEGLMLGAVSAMYNYQYQGIVFNAVSLTFAAFISLFFLYRWGIIRATGTFKKVIFGATSAIALVYLVGFIMSFFGASIPLIHGSGPVGIGFSLVVVVVASLNLVMDFDFIETGVKSGAPKYLEWYSAFGLMVTLIWLYMEMLRLLSKLNRRD